MLVGQKVVSPLAADVFKNKSSIQIKFLISNSDHQLLPDLRFKAAGHELLCDR